MPPGPAYNFFCVLSSAADILGHAARIRAAQVTNNASRAAVTSKTRLTPKSDAQSSLDVKQLVEDEAVVDSISVDEPKRDTVIRKNVESRSRNLSAYPTSASVAALPKSSSSNNSHNLPRGHLEVNPFTTQPLDPHAQKIEEPSLDSLSLDPIVTPAELRAAKFAEVVKVSLYSWHI